jgi:hypothetical protein
LALDGILLVSAFAVAFLSYAWIEKPCLALRERLNSQTVMQPEIRKQPWHSSAVFQISLLFGLTAALVPSYYVAAGLGSLRLVRGQEPLALSVVSMSAWGKSYPRCVAVEIHPEDASAPAQRLDLPLSFRFKPAADYLKLRLYATIPETEIRKHKNGRYVSDGDVYVEVYARSGEIRTLVSRRRLDTNESDFGWQRIDVPLRGDYRKLEILIRQYAEPPAAHRPRIAWLAF